MFEFEIMFKNLCKSSSFFLENAIKNLEESEAILRNLKRILYDVKEPQRIANNPRQSGNKNSELE